jgi:ubiquitin conjugation factor E4 B
VKPFPKSTLAMAACIPEEVLSSAMEVVNFVAQHAGHVFDLLPPHAVQSLLRAILAFLQSPSHIRSPHLRALFGNVLYHCFLPSAAKPHGGRQSDMVNENRDSVICVDMFHSYPLCSSLMAPALMGLYGDVEHTGFYDKLQHRYEFHVLVSQGSLVSVLRTWM